MGENPEEATPLNEEEGILLITFEQAIRRAIIAKGMKGQKIYFGGFGVAVSQTYPVTINIK